MSLVFIIGILIFFFSVSLSVVTHLNHENGGDVRVSGRWAGALAIGKWDVRRGWTAHREAQDSRV